MAQFGTIGKNPPWVRNTSAGMGQQTQLLVQATIGGQTAQPTSAPVTIHQQQQSQQQTVAQQATAAAYNAAGLTALGLAQVGLEQPRENVFLVQNAALQPGTVLSQPGVAIPTSLTTTSVGNPGIALPTTLTTTPVATVSYPAPRALQHTTQFQPQAQQPLQAQQHPPKQRVFTGTVTKLHENFGFVDNEVFFQITAIKGTIPKVGDRVLVEASYNPNMPFKWNAARIQVLPNQGIPGMPQVQVQVQTQAQPPPQQALLRPALLPTNPVASSLAPAGLAPQITIALAPQQGNALAQALTIPTLAQPTPTYNQVPPPTVIHSMASGPATVRNLPSLMGTRRHSPPPIRREREREIRRDERRERERHREREHERERERAPVARKRSRSPRPRSRSPRRRLRVAPRYMVQVPKISLDLKEANVMELRKRYGNLYIPSDFFVSSFVWMDAFPLQRPFTIERPCLFHIMSKEVDTIQENDAVLDPPDADHSFSAKVMLMASPPLEEIYQKSCSLADDTNSDSSKEGLVHPTRLINFLVGLKSKNETMAIGGPWSPSLDGPNPETDPTVLIKTAIRTCKGLTGIDLSLCTKWYRFAEVYYRRGESSHKGRTAAAPRVETVVIFLPDVWSCTPTLKEWTFMSSNYKKQLQKRLPEEMQESKDNQTSNESSKEALKKDPSHHSDLDPKSMKITGLRRELEVRSLSSKGLKSQLIARLTKALKAEHEKEEEDAQMCMEDDDADDDERTEVDEKEEERKKREEEEKRKDEREKAALEKLYALPDTPSIVVHPSRLAKGGKFDCTVMSLSVLLDYRQEDNKEYSFEVSLFAELFNEMLMRDFGFRIYRALVDIPEKKEDEKEKKKDKKEDKKDVKDDVKEGTNKEVVKKRGDEDEKDLDDEDDEEEEDEEMEEEEEDDRKDKKKDDRKKDKEKKGEKVKLCTIDPSLLLAFVYFDQNHCGYVMDKDLEEILYTLGLNLSRAQTRKLLQNAIVKDKLMYRKLTDKPKVKDGELQQQQQEEEEEENSAVNKDRPTTSLEELAAGNKGLLAEFKCLGTLKDEDQSKGGMELPPVVTESGLVTYNGALLDISKLLQQLQRSESARCDVEMKMKDMQEELISVKESATSLEQSSQKTMYDLRDYKRRLRSTEDELRTQHEKSNKYFDLLKVCHSLIQPVVVVPTPMTTTISDNDVKSERTDDSDKEETIYKLEVLENGNA